MVLCMLLGLLWVAVASAYSWSQRQYYISDHDGYVTIFRGIKGVPGDASVYLQSNLQVSELLDQSSVNKGITADSLQDARNRVTAMAEHGRTADGG
jgi:protein phosphatase